MSDATKIDKPQKIKLGDYDPDETGKTSKEESAEKMASLGEELNTLQEWLYAAGTHSVLIVLQGMDTSGKDGTIRHVMGSVNPQGCAVASFKVPTPTELAHDFLWRVHPQAPPKGMMTIFNRSHYEDILVTRVHNLIDDKTAKRRTEQIIEFEQLLAEENTIILKFFLNISKSEQKERLLEREQDPEKAWKLSTGDWHEREFWDNYQSVYEDALGATGAKDAPWYIIPANHKWARNLAVAETLVETLKPYKSDWQKTLKKLGEQRKAELAQMRATDGKSAPTPQSSG